MENKIKIGIYNNSKIKTLSVEHSTELTVVNHTLKYFLYIWWEYYYSFDLI